MSPVRLLLDFVLKWTGLEFVFLLYRWSDSPRERLLVGASALVFYSVLAAFLIVAAALGGAPGQWFVAIRTAYTHLPLVGEWPLWIPLTILWSLAAVIAFVIVLTSGAERSAEIAFTRAGGISYASRAYDALARQLRDLVEAGGRAAAEPVSFPEPTEPAEPRPRPAPKATAKGRRPEPPRFEHGDRQINAWIDERTDAPKRPLTIGETYSLHFQVDIPREDSLTGAEDVRIREGEIPEPGLDTQWIVTASTVDFQPGSPGTSVRVRQTGTSTISIAEFSLHIPATGASERMFVRVTPRVAPHLRLNVLVRARGEAYRRFSVRLIVDDGKVAATNRDAARVSDDLVLAERRYLGIRPAGEWKTPPGRVSLFVMSPTHVHVEGVVNGRPVNEILEWRGAAAGAATSILQVQHAAEQLREHHQAYLDLIGDADLEAALRAFQPTYDWSRPVERIEPTAAAAWGGVASSQQLRHLAFYGNKLYDTLFPAGTQLRKWLDQVPQGQRLDVTWLESVAGWVPHLPWALMYRTPPVPDEPIDACEFLGLRLRIDYTAHSNRLPSRALGDLTSTYRGYGMYWGTQSGDVVTEAARWQASALAKYANQVFVPNGQQTNAKTALLDLLTRPTPSPMAVLYLYCQTDSASPPTPQLRFGSTRQSSDLLSLPEIGLTPFDPPPLVFLNACISSGATAYTTNEFESLFFQRGCGAYIGTETKVPVQFASRFATVFFRFLYRDLDPAREPIAAGEAFTQTRLFFWTHFRNIGGLLYDYVNEYDLFLANDAELANWQ